MCLFIFSSLVYKSLVITVASYILSVRFCSWLRPWCLCMGLPLPCPKMEPFVAVGVTMASRTAHEFQKDRQCKERAAPPLLPQSPKSHFFSYLFYPFLSNVCPTFMVLPCFTFEDFLYQASSCVLAFSSSSSKNQGLPGVIQLPLGLASKE